MVQPWALLIFEELIAQELLQVAVLGVVQEESVLVGIALAVVVQCYELQVHHHELALLLSELLPVLLVGLYEYHQLG